MLVLFKLLLLFDITEYVERDISHFCKKSKESELDQGGERGRLQWSMRLTAWGSSASPLSIQGGKCQLFMVAGGGGEGEWLGGSVTALEGEFGQERESIRSWIIVYCWFLFHIRGIVTIAFIVLSAHWGLSDLKHLPAALGCNHFDSHGLHKAFL